jgi:hypothetical protein
MPAPEQEAARRRGPRAWPLPEFRLQRAQGIGIAEGRQLALGDQLLLHDRLLLVLRARRHQSFDRFIVPVLVGAEVDQRVFLIQALLTLGIRGIELPHPGLAIVFVARETRGGRGDEGKNQSVNKSGPGHHWFRTGPRGSGDDGGSIRVVSRFNAGVEPISAHRRRMAGLPR